MKIRGIRAVQDYLLREVQRVYRLQGVEINDKHIEVIVRQMLKKVRIEKQGDTEFLPGSLVDVLDFEDLNEKLSAEGKEQAEGVRIVLGITKAALATNSFLSAASFQETTKVLTDAAIKGRIDPHGCRDQGTHRSADRPEGECHYRTADPGRNRSAPLQRC